ncbi:hypothetical protein LBMAG27_08890 [Bacteroidota bacterium]|nr:hypothetical protein LBMAG27_08890 [Bacteroidota bacterium]
MISEKQKIRHLLHRAGLGFTPGEEAVLENKKLSEHIDELFKNSETIEELSYLPYPLKEGAEAYSTKILLLMLVSITDTQALSMAWMFRLATTKAALREQMTVFWHNHFATSVPLAYLMQVQNNTIRKNALGSFRTLAHAIAKDPAMINYLNNQQNHKNNPNENFARELMELFTIGFGNYTEKDIKESARAFTGWTIDKKGEYTFRAEDHDDGVKEFRGKSGSFNGEDIINMLLDDKLTAKFITRKIYKEFVNEFVDEERISALAEEFYNSDYDIKKLMKTIFSSEWFYEEKNIGTKIMSPVELMIRMKKLINLTPKEDLIQVKFQRVLGQLLLFPPNVAGWKGGRNWIDGASLFLRLNLALASRGKYKINASDKPQFEETGEIKPARELLFSAEWSALSQLINGETDEQLIQSAAEKLLQVELTETEKQKFVALLNQSTVETKKIDALTLIMSSPSFQLI